MASKASRLANISQHVKELRLHLCQKSASSTGTRNFIEKYYVEMKRNNPTLPILIRECSGVHPRLIARYEHGVEKSVPLADQTAEQVLSSLDTLVKNS
ncbi:NADH dehydrogenase [ubiquinone] 1 alpha subcomplex subunit 2-like [Hydractinia symbiolongicarpus]|uniref:NADH dehydrogenase [ubiquinone] 1 alpha subcomplex subunit 2-like n=1 Tax=Hydractinia symbiolongicarpus TaxID=13093 RepID=UPI00254E7086|nr:NADH dehydrogenase [ubiquinone] 1 alpha subcomplex subunit 2-like [Hydractinia symbiolongicarpus]